VKKEPKLKHTTSGEKTKTKCKEPAASSTRGGRPSVFSEKQKDWIRGCLPIFAADPVNQVVTNVLKEGVMKKILGESTSFEAVRHVLRVALKDAKKQAD
jgi:hypothetical protein